MAKKTARQRMAWWNQLLPVLLVIAPFSIAYCLIFRLLPDSIRAWEELDILSGLHDSDGIGTLFVLTSAVLGWATIATLSRQVSFGRCAVFMVAIPFWAIAVGLGFWSGLAGQTGMDNAALSLLVCSTIIVLCAGAVRAYLSEVI